MAYNDIAGVMHDAMAYGDMLLFFQQRLLSKKEIFRSHLKTMPKSGADSFLSWQGAMGAGIAGYFENMVTQLARKHARLTKWQRFEVASLSCKKVQALRTQLQRAVLVEKC